MQRSFAMTRSYAPKHTKNYNKDAVEKARSIFLPQADSEITTDLSVSIQFWLRKRGQNVQTPMTDHQKGQLKECFELIDTDGSGSLDVRELFELFDTMGLKIDRQQIYKLVSEIDEDGSGEIEFNEFLAIMHKELYESDPHASVWKDDIYTEEDRKAAMKKKSGKAVADQKKKEEKALMPLNLLAGAYRRKKVLDAVMENTGDMRKRLIASGHELRERNRQVEKASLHVEANTSTSWQQRAQTNRLVLDRVAESEALEIDILNPSLKRPAKEDEGASAKAEDEGIGEKPLGGKTKAEAGEASKPPAKDQMKKSAMTLLKDIQLNDQLGQTAGSSLVVKRDLHKREELRERIEYRSRRPAVFDEEDRKRLNVTDKVMDSIRGDEMRSLLLAGVVPRMSARQQEDGGEHTARRPSTVPTQMGMARQGSGLSWDSMGRPSTVHYGGFRPTPTTPQEISEMLAYRPVPRDLQVEDWADELLENEGSQGPRSPKAARGSVSLRELSTSRSMTPRASSPSRPGSRGVDLLAKQARKDHAMRSEALARHHSSGSLVESRHEPERLPSTGVRTTSRKESWGSSRALHKLHSMGSIPMAAAITQEVASPSNHGQPEAPGNAWVSPWTGRVSTPLIRSRGLALDARIVARTGLPPTPGVPVWKKSEEQGASQSAKVTRAVKTLPTDDDGGTTTAHRKTRSAGGSRGTYGRARGLTYADKYMSRLPATPHG